MEVKLANEMDSKVDRPPRKSGVGDPNARATATNIDRRTCHRVVPMQVMSFGLSRTGTSSMRQALIDLGYTDCYHFGAVMNENPRDAEMWVEAIEAKYEGKGKEFTQEDWDQLLGHCMALTDTPCAIFWRDLLAAYPDTKVILTVRDSPQQWFDSQMRTIMPWFDRLFLPPQTWRMWLYRKFLPPPTTFERLNELLPKHYEMYRTLAEDLRNGTRRGIKWYEHHNAEVQRMVPEERLLVMNIKEGWEPLCKFLGKDVPPWQFPKANTSQEWFEALGPFYDMIDRAVYWNALKKLGPILVVLIAVGLYSVFNRK